ASTSPTRSRTGPPSRGPARSKPNDRGVKHSATLPERSVSQEWAAAFAAMPLSLPPALADVCDSILTDVTGLCVAARGTDYVLATLRATAEPGTCTLIGHAGSFNVATAALCNGTA